MKYFFILGNHAQISLTEIVRVLERQHIMHSIDAFSFDAVILTTTAPLDIPGICNHLGGTVKAGVIHETISSDPHTIYDHLITRFTDKPQEKIVFGISAYNLAQKGHPNKSHHLNQKDVQRLGLSLKKELKSAGGVVRFIAPQLGNSLTSVVVTKNHLTNDGNAEYVLLYDENRCAIGKTEWIQPFEQYSQRDWDRPAKSMNVGMLPPKLAQIMINLAVVTPSADAVLLDPFCGLGTVLQESWLMGFRNIIGSDLENKNIQATEKNLQWLQRQHTESPSPTSLQLFQSDVRTLKKTIKLYSVDCIITEPYLGPIVNARAPQGRIVATQRELSQLYIDAFRIFADILKPHGTVSIVFPVWRVGNKTIDLSIIDAITQLGFKNETVSLGLSSYITPSKRGSFIYSRAGQTVMRELFVWRKE